MDFKMLFKLKGLWDRFSKNHPKFPSFLKEFKKNKINEGTVIDLKITFPDSKEIETNIKITQDDLNIIEELKKLKG